jgi:hypothetical protein
MSVLARSALGGGRTRRPARTIDQSGAGSRWMLPTLLCAPLMVQADATIANVAAAVAPGQGLARARRSAW